MEKDFFPAGSLGDVLGQTWLAETLGFLIQRKSSLITLAHPFCPSYASALEKPYLDRLKTQFSELSFFRFQKPFLSQGLFLSSGGLAGLMLKEKGRMFLSFQNPLMRQSYAPQSFEILQDSEEALFSPQGSYSLIFYPSSVLLPEFLPAFSRKILLRPVETSVLILMSFKDSAENDRCLNFIESLSVRYITENMENRRNDLDGNRVYQAFFFPAESFSSEDFGDLSTLFIDETMKIEEAINF